MKYQTHLTGAVEQLSYEGSREFNNWFWTKLCELGVRVAEVLQDDLVALILGGGYGRGQGAVSIETGLEMPYNDVDLFMVTKTPTPKHLEGLSKIAKEYEHMLQVSVDFSRPQTIKMIRNWPCVLMWQELALGHKVLHGPRDVIDRNVNKSVRLRLPLIEASRLLINRGAGLIWAERVIEGAEPAPDSTFVARNYFKCALGIADAVLIARGQYSSDPQTKFQRMDILLARNDSFANRIDALELLQSGLAFRRAPGKPYGISTQNCQLLAQTWMTTFLWVESQRLRKEFNSVQDYARWRGPRESHKYGILGTIASNRKRGHWSWINPIDQVYRSLPGTMQSLQGNVQAFVQTSGATLDQWRTAQ
jgi:hypothetical protein